jgi:hypothetical protein
MTYRTRRVRCTPKVTTYAYTSPRRRGWGWGYRTLGPEEARRHDFKRNLALWKQYGPGTITGTTKSTSTCVAGSLGRAFRLVDKHGREYGVRYVSTRRIRQGGYPYCYNEYEVIDTRGRIRWLRGDAPCRIVKRQPEDAHSAACRALKRAHRLGLEP